MVDILKEIQKTAVLDNVPDKPKLFLDLVKKINISKITDAETRIYTKAALYLGRKIVAETGISAEAQANLTFLTSIHKSMLDSINVQQDQFERAAENLLDVKQRNIQIEKERDLKI